MSYNWANDYGDCYYYALGIKCESYQVDVTIGSLSNAGFWPVDKSDEDILLRLGKDMEYLGWDICESTNEEPVGEKKFKIAICSQGNFYHCYRQDTNGTWSHKEYGQNPSTQDETGNEIENIIEAIKRKPGGYQLVGIFMITPRLLELEQPNCVIERRTKR